MVHSRARDADPVELVRDHDRDKHRLLAEDDPVFRALGLTDHQGRMKPSRQSKYRQVEEFLRILDASVTEALDKGHLRRPTRRAAARDRRPRLRQRLPDLRHRALPDPRARAAGPPDRHRPARAVARAQRADRRASSASTRSFVASSISEAAPATPPDVVLALHACDTATDDALARAIEWGTPVILAAPCCHHDIAAQLRRTPTPAPYAMLTRHGILRERFADTLTDGLRASLLRLEGYRVDVMQFVGSQHTPRNTLLRAVAHGRAGRRLGPPGVRRAGHRLGRHPAAGDPPRPALMRGSVLGLAVVAPFVVGLAVTPERAARHAGAALRRPGDHRGQRPRGRRRAVRDHQRLGRHRPGLRGRPARAGRSG